LFFTSHSSPMRRSVALIWVLLVTPKSNDDG